MHINIRRSLIVFCFFLLVFFDSSFFVVYSLPGYMKLVLIIFSAIGFFLLIKNVSNSITKKQQMFFLLAFCYVIISGLITASVKQTIITVVAMLAAYIFVRKINFVIFVSWYIKIIRFLSIYSLCTFAIYLVYPNIVSYLPEISRWEGSVGYYNAFFSIIHAENSFYRNIGLFWEPGAFSIFICMALFFELFIKEQADTKNVLIFVITLMSTYSTVGVCSGLVLIAAYMLQKSKKSSNTIKWMFVFLIIIGMIYLLINGDKFLYYVFGKLGLFGGKINVSTTTRIDALVYPFISFTEHPLLGMGAGSFMVMEEELCNNMATFTFINWLAKYGIFCGGYLIYGCCSFFLRSGKNAFSKMLLLLFSVALFSTENFSNIPLIFIFVGYGYVLQTSDFDIRSRRV